MNIRRCGESDACLGLKKVNGGAGFAREEEKKISIPVSEDII